MSGCGRAAVRAALVAVLAGMACAATAAPAAAHDKHNEDSDRWKKKRADYVAGVSVPLLSSPNVRFVTNIPETQAISGIFAKSAPYFYISSLDSVSVFDVRDPLHPRLTGTLPNLLFENEAMNYGEQVIDGETRRFLLLGVDLYQASTSDIQHSNPDGKAELIVVDVTDPTKPYIRARTPVSSSTHTVACVRETACRYAYSAGSNGTFSVVDLTTLDAPKEIDYDPAKDGVQGMPSPAIGWAGHKWNFDEASYGLHTTAAGTAMFDVRDPAKPRLVTTTDAHGMSKPDNPWNNFIHHNSDRPNAARFTPDAPPSLKNGNVLLVTEEDYENTDCANAGSFQTWKVAKLDGTKEAITPLDRINPVSLGPVIPHLAFCSAHWFDYHQSGIIAQGYYEGGLRLIDVRNPADLKQHGYFASALSEVWDAYWVPERTAKGVATGRKTNIVYTADLIRGVDVFTVDLPGEASDSSLPLPDLTPIAATTRDRRLATAPMIGGGAVLFAIALVPVLLRRRRRKA